MNRLTPVAAMVICCLSICSPQSIPRAVTLGKLDSRLQMLHSSDGEKAVLGKFRAMKAMTGSNNGKYRVIVYSSSIQDAFQAGVQPNTVAREFFTAAATLDQIAQLSMMSSVRHIALAKKYRPLLDKSVPEIHADKLHDGSFNGTSYTGKNVILGFVDTGIDWSHLDFRSTTDQTKSRILWIWDQLASGVPP